jgi:sugar/nucleoside kinase (ribokinase family)
MGKKFNVFGMCNALFDIQAEVNDEQLTALGVSKGAMMLLSDEEQRKIIGNIYTSIVNTESGGSGANTMIGVAQLGGTACLTSRVGRDEHGRLYAEGLSAQGVQPNLGQGGGDTGISLILISPDAERTMLTYLGMSRDIQVEDVNISDLQDSQYLYITGYLWDMDNQQECVLKAMQEANKAGVKVAFSLSDPFCVGRHKDVFHKLLADHVDVVFANDDEAKMLTDETDSISAAKKLASLSGGLAAVTRGSQGAVLVQGDTVTEIAGYKVTALDTTGAGDMYAAGVLYGLTQNLPLHTTGKIAAYCAAQVVAKVGPRLESIDKNVIDAIIAEG